MRGVSFSTPRPRDDTGSTVINILRTLRACKSGCLVVERAGTRQGLFYYFFFRTHNTCVCVCVSFHWRVHVYNIRPNGRAAAVSSTSNGPAVFVLGWKSGCHETINAGGLFMGRCCETISPFSRGRETINYIVSAVQEFIERFGANFSHDRKRPFLTMKLISSWTSSDNKICLGNSKTTV